MGKTKSIKPRIQLGAMLVLVLLAIALLLSQQVGPDAGPLFQLKRVQEKVFLKTKLSASSQVDYMSNLLETRLGELQNAVNNQNYGYVLPSSLRYFTLAGQITDLIVANNLTSQTETIRNQFLSHRKILDQLYVIYPKNTDNWEWKYIKDDYNYLKLYLDKLEKVK
ncbi:MAG: hypothetical protein M1142_05695 [Patescibacteria group bacterium]|nr:hypothetical protein [Patescibacteria group bacterium]